MRHPISSATGANGQDAARSIGASNNLFAPELPAIKSLECPTK